MDQYLAELIIEYEVEIFPYLKLRAIQKVQNKDVIKVFFDKLTLTDLKMLEVSGLVRIISEFPDYAAVTLYENGSWMGYPPERKQRKVRVRQDYTPTGLQKLADILGYPGDWEKSLGKYRKLYFSVLKRYSQLDLEKIATWVAQEYPEYRLPVILTENWIKSLKYKMENEKTYKARNEGYDDESSVLAYEQEFLSEN